MKYTHFEELPVWQNGISLSVRIFGLTEDKAFRFKVYCDIMIFSQSGQ